MAAVPAFPSRFTSPAPPSPSPALSPGQTSSHLSRTSLARPRGLSSPLPKVTRGRRRQDLGHLLGAVPASHLTIPTVNILVLGAGEFCPSDGRPLSQWVKTCSSLGSEM